MANSYNFDFLRNEHLDDSAKADGPSSSSADTVTPTPTVSSFATPKDFAAAANKPDLEKQFDILAFLQAHRGSGCIAPSVIYRSTGIDLDVDTQVADMLQRNPKVKVEMIPDPENPALLLATYAYQAKFATVRDRTSLLAQINRMTSGVSMRDLLDSYLNVEKDLQGLITAGDVIAVQNTEDKDKILFPRGEPFLVELDGIISLPPPKPIKNGTSQEPTANGATYASEHQYPITEIEKNGEPDPDESTSASNGSVLPPPIKTMEAQITNVETDLDPCSQIRRGEAIQIGGQWFRVSSAVKEGVPLSEQPARAQAPLSVVSFTDLSKRNEVDGYIRRFSNKEIPTDVALTGAAQRNLRQAKAAREKFIKLAHGRSGGVASQLLGSHAHASNPTTLASSFAGSTSSMRKRPARPTMASANSSSHINGTSTKEDLEKVASDPALALYTHARRHGCTLDVRDMYLATRTVVAESDRDLKQILLEHKLLDPSEQLRRPRLAKSTNVDNDGKPKKRRYYERKNQRMTNTHLEGTEIGAVLARAAEKQKQGKSVGDGGM